MKLLLLGSARQQAFPPNVLPKRGIGGQTPEKTQTPEIMSVVPLIALCGLNRFICGRYHSKAEIVLQCSNPVSVVIQLV